MDIINDANATYVVDGTTEAIKEFSVTVDVLQSQGLNIQKSSNKSVFVPGDIIDYTITITNSSNHYLNGVRIIDDLGGNNLAYVLGSANLTVGTLTYKVNPISTNPLTFTLQQLAVGQTMVLTYKSQVIFNLPATINSITNSVKGIGYTSSGTIVGYDNTTIQKKSASDFSMEKSASVDNVIKGQLFSYYIKYINNTSSNITVIETVDQLPNSFVLTSVDLIINGNTVELDSEDYNLSSANLLTLPSAVGPLVTVESGKITTIVINGYFQ